jgi:hypothetical protein
MPFPSVVTIEDWKICPAPTEVAYAGTIRKVAMPNDICITMQNIEIEKVFSRSKYR